VVAHCVLYSMQLAQVDMRWHIVFCTACIWHRSICGGTLCSVKHAVGTGRYVVAHCFLYSLQLAQINMWWDFVFCTACVWHSSICGGPLCSVQLKHVGVVIIDSICVASI